MKSFWRNKMDNREPDTTSIHTCSQIECCICKKVFMTLVILILTFMAGIMVGNCGKCHYQDTYYYHTRPTLSNTPKKKLHRGMHTISPSSTPSPEMGGFIIEIDQAN